MPARWWLFSCGANRPNAAAAAAAAVAAAAAAVARRSVSVSHCLADPSGCTLMASGRGGHAARTLTVTELRGSPFSLSSLCPCRMHMAAPRVCTAVRTGGAPRRQAVRSSVRSTGLHTCSESRDAACALERHTPILDNFDFFDKMRARARARRPAQRLLSFTDPPIWGEPTPSSGSLTHSQAKPRSDRRCCLKE